MAYEFKLPDLGEGLSEGEIARWLVAEGQEIAEDDPLVEIATDKTTVEIPSPAGGVVARILVAEGEVVPVGTVLVVIGGDGAEAAAAEPEEQLPGRCPRRGSRPDASRNASRGGRVRATPRVRRVAAGARGRSRHRGGHPARRAGSPRRTSGPPSPVRHVSGSDPGPRPDETGVRREPLHGVRRQMFQHLTRAHREIPAVTWVEECDFTAVDLKRLLPLVLQAVGGVAARATRS